MIIFTYDKTFEGLLTAIFESYSLKVIPDLLLRSGEPLPIFYERCICVETDVSKSERVLKSMEKKLSKAGLAVITANWLSELPDTDLLIFKYICKAINASKSIELNFGDPDVLLASNISKKVSQERHRVIQFLRFQKTADCTYFAAIEPLYNILPIAIQHFKERFTGQKWIIYDMKRDYGFYYDMSAVTEIRFETGKPVLPSGKMDTALMAHDEKVFQELWKAYFKSTTIKERRNPKLHRQNLPVRFWKYLIEKQG